jgi:KAP family P-loop domain
MAAMKEDSDSIDNSALNHDFTDNDRKEQNLSSPNLGAASSTTSTGPVPPPDQKGQAPIAAQADGVSAFSPDNTASSDEPDVLGIDADARALARLMCLEGASPLAIAVLGGWGTGKSTFMERLDREVRDTVRDRVPKTADVKNPAEARIIERVVQIRFNAWQFVDANLWASLTSEFFAQLRAGGWEGQTDASYAGLVERVTRHVHNLNADLEVKRKIASDSALKTAEARMTRDQAKTEARKAGERVLEQSALDDLRKLYDSQRSNLSALGLAVAGDDTTESVDAIIAALNATHSITGQIKLIASMLLKHRRRLWTTLAIACGLIVFGLFFFFFFIAPFNRLVPVLSWIGAVAALSRGALPALQFVRSVTKHGAEIARQVEEADRSATAKLLESEIRLKEAEKKSESLEADADDASKRLALYVDPSTPTNPPRLLRYVLEDDPETRALEAQLGLIGRTRRLFQAVDAIAQKEREKQPAERDKTVPDRIILYIDDLDRCSEEQVYKVLQAIHLLLAFELFVVVVGVDIARVQTALARFAEGLGQRPSHDRSQQNLAAQYLDKIFQIAFWLSPLTMGGDGSYGPYVELLANPRSNESAQSPATGSTPSDGVHRGLTTITLEQEEVKFLASDAIGRLAVSTPRSVKRLVNCYRLVRTRLGEKGDSRMGGEGRPRLYPIIGLTVAVETGQSPEIAAEFYRGLMAEEPRTSANNILNTPSSPFGQVLSASEPLRNAYTYAISDAGDSLTIQAIQRVARIARRFSFNPPG